MPPLQVEKAQYSLIQKLIALKFYKIALKEIKSLKKKLDERMDEERGGNSTEGEHSEGTGSGRNSSAAKKISTMADLFRFDDIPERSIAAPLATSAQICVLRCLSGLKDPDLIEVRSKLALIPLLTLLRN